MTIKNTIKFLLAALAIIGFVGLSAQPALADDFSSGISGGADLVGGDSNKTSIQEIIKKVTNILLYMIGAVSVIMLIYGGFKYTTSGGDAGKVGEAKNTILYAIIGVIVAILAYAIVNFVITQFTA